ncbi:hypothetical protein WN944_013669 [Citrus x changshan-huyou]|uniref:Amine oxidase n=1 Tax=Citrus x changshan-huyou TaxID=2935761 RepID=A0AAP0QKU1_9ROSI
MGNYDCIFDWELQTDGLILIKVSRPGYMSGPLVCENVIGVVHDHFITLHLDMDIDGANNSFVEVHLEKQETCPGESPRKGYLKIEQRSRLGNPSGHKAVPGGNAATLLRSAFTNK